MIKRTLIVSALTACTFSGMAITPGQVDDFQDGTTQEWKIGTNVTPATPVNNQNCGDEGVGDNCLSAFSNGGGAGGKLIIINPDQWTGDYAAGNVAAIRFKARIVSGSPVTLRVGFADSTGNNAIGDNTEVIGPPAALSSDGAVLNGDYQTFEISVLEEDMFAVNGGSVSAARADVQSLWIVDHPDTGFWFPQSSVGQIDFDDIELVIGAVDEIFIDGFEASSPVE